MPATFGDVYEQLCERWSDPRERGRQFEPLVAQVLRTDRMFRDRYAAVWLWSDWPGRRSVDIGVDIVAQRHDGGLTAIQCKCYDPGATLYEQDVSTFLAYTNADFDERLIISTTPNWSRNLLALIANQRPPVQRLDLFGLEATTIDWDAYLDDDAAPLAERPRKEVRPHQQRALDDVFEGFEEHDRGKLIMACGTGKTFTALRVAEEQVGPGGRVLFAAPSISLVAQALREWAADAETPIRAFAVCSDARVGRGDGDGARPYDLPIPATTDPSRLAEAAAAEAPDRLTVVFSTYQSMDVIRRAQDAGMPAFDLAVCDEAHRTTGYALEDEERSSFLLVHDAEAIRARKRLYMTATPRIYNPAARRKAEEADAYVASMDDEATYGPELHRLGFADAVDAELLSDYKVAILVMDEEQLAREYQRELADPESGLKIGDVGRVIGCLNGLAKLDPEHDQFGSDPAPMRRAVAFSNTIKASQHFVDLVGGLQDDAGREQRGIQAEARHVDGASGVLLRARQLNWLGEHMAFEGQCHILSNARCLTEGIDVPSLDAVLFLQPRKSQIDVVQAVGRVMRRAEDKRFGYVILPVVVPAGDDPAASLDRNNAYAHVWEVLQALRSHDERFDAWVNKLDLNRNRDGAPVAVIGVGPREPREEGAQPGGTNGAGASGYATPEVVTQHVLGGLDERIEQWREAIYAKIVERCGERRYWEQWAESVTDIARRHHERIRALIAAPGGAGESFGEFVAALRNNLNDSISEDDAAAMLSQHLITKPVFDALFGGSEFTALNPVSQVMQGMLDELEGRGLEEETEALAGFYTSVRRRVQGIDNAEGRQRVAIELYDNFFRRAFPRDAERLGIVYTPVEIVDFIIRSVAELLRENFGASLRDEGVHILDPFTGTGTFIARLLQSGLIGAADLPRKYRGELHANEILLLAYYIAAVNIENAYRDVLAATGEEAEYEPFGGIVLADTFQMSEEDDPMDTVFFPRNNDRADRQKGLDIRVIVGNPPYSGGQRSENDNNQNLSYPTLDASIMDTYAKRSLYATKWSLYDSYVRAIRWASNRLAGSPNGGVIGYVTNGGWLDGNAASGLRDTLTREFHHIYVYNLRGNTRTSGEQARREGGQTFGPGSRATVAITLLVKKPVPVPAGGGTISYHDIGDYLSREEKLAAVSEASVASLPWQRIMPNDHHDWLKQRDERYSQLVPLAGEADSIFQTVSHGLVTNRDAWVYNSSEPALRQNVDAMVDFYNAQVDAFAVEARSTRTRKERAAQARAFVDKDPTRFSWNQNDYPRVVNGERYQLRDEMVRTSLYRPFFKQIVAFDRTLNNVTYRLPGLYPTRDSENIGFSIVGTGTQVPFGCLATNTIPQLHLIGASSGTIHYPRWRYEDTEAAPTLLAAPRGGRVSNLNPQALARFRATLGGDLTDDDVLYYVYGILHSSDFRSAFETNLKKERPRVPILSSRALFDAFAEAGRELCDFHVGYETVEPYPLTEEWAAGVDTETNPDLLLVGTSRMRYEKASVPGTGHGKRDVDRSRLRYNDYLTLAGIPPEAHEYVLGTRSGIDWIIDRYYVRTDKASGIVNDPNQWALERGDPRYVVDLIKRVVAVSVRTVEIVSGLPSLEETIARLGIEAVPQRRV